LLTNLSGVQRRDIIATGLDPRRHSASELGRFASASPGTLPAHRLVAPAPPQLCGIKPCGISSSKYTPDIARSGPPCAPAIQPARPRRSRRAVVWG
jgi:hypothetical protein